MPRCTKLRPNLFSADLLHGSIDLNPNRGFSCFFIVEHTDDREFIEEQAIQLLLAGCRSFDFYGKQEPAWHCGVDEADSRLFPNTTEETVALTSGWNTIDEFVGALHDALSCRYFVPHDFYLLYDDEAIYKEVLHLLDNEYQP